MENQRDKKCKHERIFFELLKSICGFLRFHAQRERERERERARERETERERERYTYIYIHILYTYTYASGVCGIVRVFM